MSLHLLENMSTNSQVTFVMDAKTRRVSTLSGHDAKISTTHGTVRLQQIPYGRSRTVGTYEVKTA